MTYGKMSSMNMNRTASAVFASAGFACTHSAANIVMMIMDAMLLASIIICGLITLLGILGILGVLLLVLLAALLVVSPYKYFKTSAHT